MLGSKSFIIQINDIIHTKTITHTYVNKHFYIKYVHINYNVNGSVIKQR